MKDSSDNSESIHPISFTSGDVERVTNLSSRNLTDWEKRAGIIKPAEGRETKWRRFSKQELYALKICVRLRDKFNLTLEHLKRLNHWLIEPENVFTDEGDFGQELLEMMLDHVERDEALGSKVRGDRDGMAESLRSSRRSPVDSALNEFEAGKPIFLLTDFDQHFGILPKLGVEQILEIESFSVPSVLYQLNHVFDAVRSRLGVPPIKGKVMTIDEMEHRLTAPKLSPAERQVIEMMRQHRTQTISFTMTNGNIRLSDSTIQVPDNERRTISEALKDVISQHDHQELRLTVRKGRLALVEQTAKKKLD